MVQNKAIIIIPIKEGEGEILSAIRNAFLDFEIEVVGLSDTRNIIKSIKESNYVVVDVSDQNPEVMYALGNAVSLRKSVIILLSALSNEKLPPDLYNQTLIVYEPDHLEKLTLRLKKIVERQLV